MVMQPFKEQESPQERVIPVVPGSPWAPPQRTEVALRPDMLPPPQEPSELPSDRLAPADPTVRFPVMSTDPLLQLPPEGMLRLVKEGEQDCFCFPVHADGWRALGWQVVLPISTEDDDDGGGGGGGVTPPALVPTVDSINPKKPLTALGKNVAVGLVGTGFEPTGDVVVWGDSQAAAGDYTFRSATQVQFHMDCSLVGEACEVPFVVTNSAGESQPYNLSVGPPKRPAEADGLELPTQKLEPKSEPEPALIDYAAMTKAEITNSVQLNYGVVLDHSMTKAEMVAEAERLDLQMATVLDTEPALPELPADLLG